MPKKDFKIPPPSPNDRATLEFLAEKGIKVDPVTGQVTGDPFQGGSVATEDPGESPGFEEANRTFTQDVSPLDRIQAEESESDLPPESGAEPEPEPSQEPEPERLKGEAKREADARKAQSEFHKTQTKLEKTLLAAEGRIAELQEYIDKAETVRAIGSGTVPPDLNPADAELMASYREEYPEAIQVMEAIVAPYAAMIGQLKEQITGLNQSIGTFFAKQKNTAVEDAIYEKIPKATIQRLNNDPAFIDWIASKPKDEKDSVIKWLSIPPSSLQDPRTIIKIYQDFARETGASLGTTAAPARREQPEMDRTPNLGSPNTLPGGEPQRRPSPENQIVPFSAAELAQPGFLREVLSEGTTADRDIARKRLALSGLAFDGVQAQTMFNGRT
jgi:hypothetical protein